jgi:hypothetical protein
MSKMDNFSVVREIPIVEIAQYYGIETHRKGAHWWANCVDHEDKTPSLRFNTNTNRFCCYSCGLNGSSIDLVSKMFGLNLMDSVKKINSDFALGLDLEGALDQKGISKLKEIRRQREAQRLLTQWRDKTYNILCLYHRVVYGALQGMKPSNEYYKQTVENQAYLEYILDIVQFADNDSLKEIKAQIEGDSRWTTLLRADEI